MQEFFEAFLMKKCSSIIHYVRPYKFTSTKVIVRDFICLSLDRGPLKILFLWGGMKDDSC